MRDNKTEMEQLTDKFRKNIISDKELERFYFLLEQNGEVQLIEDLINETWQKSKADGTTTGKYKKQKIYNKITRQAGLKESFYTGNSEKPGKYLHNSLKVAASILFIVAGGFAVYHFSHTRENMLAQEPAWISYSSSDSTRKHVVLPDKTSIWLAKNSTIEVDPQYSKNNRQVKLSGDAFFKVTPDKTSPFSIIAKDTRTTVLGTSFYIETKVKNQVKVSVATGKVKVSANSTRDSIPVYLTPGRQARIVNGAGSISTHKIYSNYFMGLTDMVFNFNDMELGRITEILSRAYSANISFARNDIKRWKYTGKFDNISLEQILERISESKTFRFKALADSSIQIY